MEEVLVPHFVRTADSLFTGVVREYSALKRLSSVVLAGHEAHGLERTMLLQSGIAWQHYHAILLLLSASLGMQSLVVCRTLFELVVVTLYLLKTPTLLDDFIDHGKLTLYKQATAAGLSGNQLAPIRQECEQIQERFKKRKLSDKWHGSSIKKMATAVRLDVHYDLFYFDASSPVGTTTFGTSSSKEKPIMPGTFRLSWSVAFSLR
jgi:hypothetical protein